jgi:hypothetical protein
MEYDKKYVSGLTNIDVDGEERPQCILCMKIWLRTIEVL